MKPSPLPPRGRRAALSALGALALGLVARPLGAEEALPSELEGLAIEPKPGAELPRDLELTDHDGNVVKLGDYLDGKPLVLQFAYYDCPMLCSLVLNGALTGMRGVDWTAGDQYRVVVVSFDPRDTAAKAKAKRQSYAAEYGREIRSRGWDFLVGDPAKVKALADAVGFRFRWDADSQQFGHDAGLFLFSPEGKLVRVLFGIEFDPKTLRLGLVEASQGKLGGVWDHMLLACYTYDANAKSYVMGARRVMKAGGAVTAVGLGLFLRRLWKAERRGIALPTANPTDSTDTSPLDGASPHPPRDASAPALRERAT